MLGVSKDHGEGEGEDGLAQHVRALGLPQPLWNSSVNSKGQESHSARMAGGLNGNIDKAGSQKQNKGGDTHIIHLLQARLEGKSRIALEIGTNFKDGCYT